MTPSPARIVAGLLVAATAAGAASAAPPLEDGKAPLDFERVIATAKARVFPALVFVRPVQEDLSSGKKQRVEVFGSGVIVDPKGIVVTNHHVAEKAREIRCVLNDRRQVEARLVGLDRATDLAVLRLVLPAGESVPAAELGESRSLEEGQFVMALGAPYGFERSISLGIVSNARRHLGDDEEGLYNDWVQTDAAINPGNSGGPLVDTKGRVVGINTLGIGQANGLGFSIPVDVVKRVVERIRKDGRVVRSQVGVTLRPLVDYMQNTVFPGEKGVIVDDVRPGGAAEAAGMRKGDRLLSVGGAETNGRWREDLPEIRWALADLAAGKPAEFVVERDGARKTLVVTPAPDDDGDEEGFEARRWDATFQTIHRERVPDLAFHRATGVYVLGVKYGGPAAQGGLREGDVVVSVDRKPVPDLAALRAAYEDGEKDPSPTRVVLVEVLRSGRRAFLAIGFARADETKDE
jgi:S1-C subfamily serine protease